MTVITSKLDNQVVLEERIEGDYRDLAGDLLLELGERSSELAFSADRLNHSILIVAGGLSVEYRAL